MCAQPDLLNQTAQCECCNITPLLPTDLDFFFLKKHFGNVPVGLTESFICLCLKINVLL